MKTTPWFEAGKENPVRVGVYEVETVFGKRYKYWGGTRWSWGARNPFDAQRAPKHIDSMQDQFTWRGLLKESE
jgi:hypothetical protein